MGRVDKMEDYTGKLFRDYQDQWSKYAEALEKGEGSVKVLSKGMGMRIHCVLRTTL